MIRYIGCVCAPTCRRLRWTRDRTLGDRPCRSCAISLAIYRSAPCAPSGDHHSDAGLRARRCHRRGGGVLPHRIANQRMFTTNRRKRHKQMTSGGGGGGSSENVSHPGDAMSPTRAKNPLGNSNY